MSESRGQHEEEDSVLSLAKMEQGLICNFYLLITTYSYLPDEAVLFARQFGLLPRLLTVLTVQSLDQRVRYYVRCGNALAFSTLKVSKVK